MENLKTASYLIKNRKAWRHCAKNIFCRHHKIETPLQGKSWQGSKRFRKSSSQKNYAFLSYDVYMTYITSRDISRESREATDQSERLNKYGSHRCFLPGRIGRKRLCRRLSFFGPRTLTVTLPKPL